MGTFTWRLKFLEFTEQTFVFYRIKNFRVFTHNQKIYLLNSFPEAQIRFLKAKLRVMQEELDRLSQDCNNKVNSTKAA